MDAVRQIYESVPDMIQIPPELRRRRVEVIILPLDEEQPAQVRPDNEGLLGLVWVYLPDPCWHQGYPSLVKENCRPESGPISKPVGPRLDLLNRRVDRFGASVSCPQLDCIQNSSQMRFDHSSNLDHRLEPAT